MRFGDVRPPKAKQMTQHNIAEQRAAAFVIGLCVAAAAILTLTS